jgi:type IV secretion system protein TrbL
MRHTSSRRLTALELPWPRRVFLVVLIVVLLSAALTGTLHAQTAADAPVFNGIRDAYRFASGNWRARLVPIAQRIFMLLAALEFTVSGIVWMLKRESLDELAAKFLLKFTLIAFLLTLITSFTVWVPPIINGFAVAGQYAAGRGAASPSGVVELGRATAMGILHALSLTVLAKDPAMVLFAAASAVIVALAYIAIAAQLALVMIESYIVVLGGGVAFLGFASSRWTASLADNLLLYAVHVGVRMFLLYLITGVGVDVARSWLPLIQSPDFLGNGILQVTGGAVIFALITVRVPNTVAGRLSGSNAFGIAQALRALS